MTEEDNITWELAKREIDNMPEPQLFSNQNLLHIQGYACTFHVIKDSPKKQVILWNEKYRTSYSKYFDGLKEYREVRGIFNK